jgi:hypothetical protein
MMLFQLHRLLNEIGRWSLKVNSKYLEGTIIMVFNGDTEAETGHLLTFVSRKRRLRLP